MRLMLMAQEN
eukprot:gene17611-23186_t